MSRHDAALFKALQQAIDSGRDIVLATVVSQEGSTPRDAGAKMLVFGDKTTLGTVGGGKLEAKCIEDALDAIASGRGGKKSYLLTAEGIGMECAGRTEIFFEVYAARLKLFILGCGHVSQKIAEVASTLGLLHSVVDDRAEFANRDNFPRAANIYVEEPHKAATKKRIDDRTYIIIATRGHALDQECLEAALKTKAAYIGMIGSKQKVPTVFRRLNAKGLRPDKDPRVYSPIGLDVGGKTPGEIAVSVLAEVLKLANGRSGRHYREFLPAAAKKS
ncbi:MAG TPA: XdhC/CoxI family protein [Elusimicrobiales bacterium]|nr:XdhC/CoxI family protein [Elusimicrobiales bacterium]